jgi:hypothetical protein
MATCTNSVLSTVVVMLGDTTVCGALSAVVCTVSADASMGVVVSQPLNRAQQHAQKPPLPGTEPENELPSEPSAMRQATK